MVNFSGLTTELLLKPIVIFSQNWQLNQHLSQKIAQFVQRIYTTCNIDFTRKMTPLPKLSLHNMIFWIKITIFQQMKYFNEN